jgi:hypothetical protein
VLAFAAGCDAREIAPVVASTVDSSVEEVGILKWTPGNGEQPRVAVEVQWLMDNDYLSPEVDGVGKLQPLGALMDAFCGEDPVLRQSFSEWVSEYAFPNFYYHPQHPKPEDETVVVTSYKKPYEALQPLFLDWMQAHRGQDDFLMPAARQMNPYRGELIDPVVEDFSSVTEETLQQTFGYVAVAKPDSITFIGDNRYNPFRWICPINEIHAREQPSWGMRLHSTPEAWDATVDILKAAKTGMVDRRIILRYEIELQIEDHRSAMGESSFQDYLKSGEPDSVGLLKQMYTNTQTYASGQSKDGVHLLPIQQKMIEKYAKTRLEPVNFQLSVGINFRQREPNYRLAEFMLCTYNQVPVGVFPEEANGKGFLATGNEPISRFVSDGGNSGHVAWWRLPIDVLHNPALRQGQPSAWQGSDYLELEEPELEETVFKGEIDVTEFYRQAIAAKAFPGQRGLWVNRWVGFEGDVPDFQNPDEAHGIDWAFFIFESHGPLKVVAQVRQLEVVISD